MTCGPAEARPAFRLGVRERNGRERSEYSADDHTADKETRSLCGRKGQAQSPDGDTRQAFASI
jgi:hypothetical protein